VDYTTGAIATGFIKPLACIKEPSCVSVLRKVKYSVSNVKLN
jgi:hypothetical protein